MTLEARGVAFALVTLHCALLAWGAWRQSPTSDELAHLTAGLSYWDLGRFDLYNVNPPLQRLVGAAAVALAQPNYDWAHYPMQTGVRPEWVVADDFVRANGKAALWYLTIARWACIPFSILGAWVCFRWAQELYGGRSGLLALVLWCFSPNVLAYGALFTPDMAGIAVGGAAFYCFWKWLRNTGRDHLLTSGVLLGCALLTKATWIISLGLWPCLWIASRIDHPATRRASIAHEAAKLLVIVAVSICVLNVGYAFEGAFQPLDRYAFVSKSLGGPHARPEQPSNRFLGTWLGSVPVPLPHNFVAGIDAQKRDFERRLWAYLGGEWQRGGWWYYYIYGLAIKVPLGTLLLTSAASVLCYMGSRHRTLWRDEIALLVPLITILAFVSGQIGVNAHVRYALPILPFLFVHVSRVISGPMPCRRSLTILVRFALIWSISSSLWIYPHSLSYFNEAVGGPRLGHMYLVNSNIDWGQDSVYLKKWIDRHAEAQPIKMVIYGPVNPAVLGIAYEFPGSLVRELDNPHWDAALETIEPGWYAVSVNYLRGHAFAAHEPGGGTRNVGSHRDSPFLRRTPVALVGYSIYVYHIQNGRE